LVDFTGKFYKTDCDFDADFNLVDVKVSTDDGYDDLKTVLNSSYNLIDLLPPSISIKYKLRPVLQVITRDNVNTSLVSNDKLTNIIGTNTWEESIDSSLNPLNYGFQVKDYALGTYQIYYRYLTTLNDFNSVPVSLRETADISAVSAVYKYVSNEVNDSLVIIDTRFSTTPTEYGLSARCAGHEDEYYTPAGSSSLIYIPINISEWVCNSWWFTQSVANNAYEQANSDTVSVPNSYYVSDVIQLLLEQGTDILHLDNTAYSEFFYDTVDPVAGEKWDLVISPKSNFANAYYSDPARTADIRLSDVLGLMKAFKVGWHIEVVGTEKRLRLEHISWYENGGTYGTQVVSVDITQSLDNRVSKVQSYQQNKFSYQKSNMPERYEFNWQSDVVEYFNGSPIEIITREINEGLIKTVDNLSFNPDIDAIAAKTGVSLDGFVVVSTELSGSTRVVKFTDIEVFPGYNFSIQNGVMSYQYLHPLYHRYGLPAENVTINGEATTALSITRNKQQEIVFQYSENINPLNLITTELGSGQVDKMTFNIVSNTYKATINLDTE